MKIIPKNVVLSLAILLIAFSCNYDNQKNTKHDDRVLAKNILPLAENFRDSVDGKKTAIFILRNKNGLRAAITNYGGRIVSLIVPDSQGKMTDVVAGFSNILGYRNSTEPYFGAIIGRYGNRIAKGKFTLGGKRYTLSLNNGQNTLHGGKIGFQDVVWDATQSNFHSLTLSYLSRDMEEGFPGNLLVKVTYSLSDNDELKISYDASTDQTTVINLTNHAFFNLNGIGSGSILNHKLTISSSNYLPVDSTLIPNGYANSVVNTPFDFRTSKSIGQCIDSDFVQLKYGKGYDHNFILDKRSNTPAAIVRGDKSGIILEIVTDQPGMQFYSGNFMQGKNNMKNNIKDSFRTAFSLEPQHFPNSPNQPNFPSTVLKPGKHFKSISIYRFKKSNIAPDLNSN